MEGSQYVIKSCLKGHWHYNNILLSSRRIGHTITTKNLVQKKMLLLPILINKIILTCEED